VSARALLALLLVSACGRTDPGPAPVAASVPVAAPAPLVPSKPRHTLRVVAVAGQVTPALHLGDAPVELTATLARGAALTLAVDDDVRIALYGPARVALRGEGAPVLLLHHGIATLDVAPQAVRAGRAPFALATPAAQLEVPFAARLVLRALEGAHELAVVSGEVSLSQPARTLQVGAGARYCFTAKGPHELALEGFATLEAAATQLPVSNACARQQPPDPNGRDRELSQRLDALAAAHAEERALLADATARPADELRALLATLAQATIAGRSRALALRAELAAAQLEAEPDPGRTALLARAAALESPAR
jgi:hypothetical protein